MMDWESITAAYASGVKFIQLSNTNYDVPPNLGLVCFYGVTFSSSKVLKITVGEGTALQFESCSFDIYKATLSGTTPYFVGCTFCMTACTITGLLQNTHHPKLFVLCACQINIYEIILATDDSIIIDVSTSDFNCRQIFLALGKLTFQTSTAKIYQIELRANTKVDIIDCASVAIVSKTSWDPSASVTVDKSSMLTMPDGLGPDAP